MTIHRNLGGGLLLRGVTPADVEPLAAFQARHMHFPMGFHVREWLRGDHPTADTDGFTVVEDTATGEIVSAAALLPQALSFDGVPFAAGRVEAVATRPDHRRRGLVRAQFEQLHRWALGQGQLLQIVEGATWLYRDFGYVPALDNWGGMNSGGRVALAHRLPRLADGGAEPFVVRPAEAGDLSFVAELCATSRRRYGLAAVEGDAVWPYVLRGGEPGYNRWFDLRVIADAVSGEKVGFVVHDPWGCGRVLLYEVRDGVSWLSVTPTVLRQVSAACRAKAEADNCAFDGLGFALAPGHPVFAVSPHWLTPDYDRHMTWGVRIPDVVAFLRHVAPALSARLATSPAAGHTGELRFNLYRSGVHLVLERGEISAVEPWTPSHERDGDAGFVGGALTPLLCGHRTFEELRAADPDTWAGSNEAVAVLNCLFPRTASHVLALA